MFSLKYLMILIGVACAACKKSLRSQSLCHVSNVFGNHMVLQRDRPALIYGFADPGVLVTVSLNGVSQPASAADSTGVWRTSLPAQPATTSPSTFTFSCSDGTTPPNLVDVLFGDVHICSGQSNMQFTPLSNAGVPNITQELAAANLYPLIRTFTVGEGTSSTTPLVELKTILQNWSVASNVSIGGPGWSYTSAVCWFTYRDVFNELGGTVPQGIIGNNWGGTPIQHWSSPDAMKICNGGNDSTLWNAMVVPYVTGPMAVRTAIWYQVSIFCTF
jgi:sialate O-acetylesterase